jgi:hypothetical protein
MGGSISKQQKQQIATYRTKFLLGEPNLNLMKDEDLHENEQKCRQVAENFKLNKKDILNEILLKIESNADEIVDNNGILLCNSPLITNVLQSHMDKSPEYKKYLEEQEKLAKQSLNNLETNQQQPNFITTTSTTPVTTTSTTPVTATSATTASTKPATTVSTPTVDATAKPVTTTAPPSDKTAKPTVESKKGGKSSSRKRKALKLYY